MRILVTGGAGFLGSHLCDVLMAQGNEVWCLDNFMSGRRANIEHLMTRERFHLLKHDVRKPLRWRGPLDRIYHLACPASPVYYQFDHIETLETAFLGTQEMLKLADRTGAKLLYTSSSEAYGDPLEHPQKETYTGNVNTMGPKASYEEGKRIGETLCKDYREQRGVDARVVRFFNVYGPRMLFHDGRVVSNFVRQAILGEDITVHGDGLQTRSFLYVDDAIPALIGVMEKAESIGPFNIGNPDERTIKEIAEIVRRETVSASRIVNVPIAELPGRVGDCRRRCPDTTRLKSILPEWEPKTGLLDGLKKTIEDFKQRIVRKSRVLVFIPSFHPSVGPAERLVMETARHLQDWDVTVITSRERPDRSAHDRVGAVDVHRVGFGSAGDKYFLPILGALKAAELSKRAPFQILWAIPVSYGAMAAWMFNLFRWKRVAVFYSGCAVHARARQGWRAWIGKLLFKRADRWQLVSEESGAELAAPAAGRHVHRVWFDAWDEVAKRTRTVFQELEILGTKR